MPVIKIEMRFPAGLAARVPQPAFTAVGHRAVAAWAGPATMSGWGEGFRGHRNPLCR
ncbi:hypothetical protein [Streptomyces sp. NPDC016626]|uniref:hypothetical protein n=1 Tax=Streptomyces sp. NPDC016626 TaxID=3364968 RepID=UPI0036F69306